MSRGSTDRDAGMSIVEALVALAVFAMAGVGLVELQAQSLRTLSRVESRALGDIIAQNQLVGALAARTAPEPGERRGAETLAGRAWKWRLRVSPTADAGTLRVDVEVRASEDGPVLAAAHGFTPSTESGT